MKEVAPLDHEALVDKHIATEYSETVRLRGYIKALLAGHTLLDQVFNELGLRLDIDAMRGANLDVIGRIVGQPRIVIDASGVPFFGFLGHPQAYGFGSPADPSLGGRFRAPGEPLTGNKRLIDSDYRTFIKARIIRNHSKSLGDDVIEMFKFLLGQDTPIYVTSARPRPGHGWIGIGRRLTAGEAYLMANTDLIPTTLGVTYHIRDFTRPFGFLGVPGVGGFGDPNDPTVGGQFPRVIA